MNGEEQNTAAALEQMSATVDGAWKMMLSQATAQGFTRQDIIKLTLQTVTAILDSTGSALWTETVPDDEKAAREFYRDTIDYLHTNTAALF